MNGQESFNNMFINIFDNSYTEGICGGNVRCAQIFKNIRKFDSDLKLRLVGSKKCQTFYRDFGLFESELVTSKEKEITNFYWTYFCRLCRLSFWSLVGRFKKQIIYANSDYLVDVLPAFLSKIFYKITWIQISQLIIDHPKKRENTLSNYIAYYFQRISFRLMRRADLVITDGYEIKDFLINKFNFNPQLVKAGFLGVDFELVDKTAAAKESNDLIFVGTLDKRKGVGDFIEICANLMKDGVANKAVIIAEKIDKLKELQELIRQHKVSDKFEFTGKLKHNKIFSLLKNSKVFVFPSYNESWGLVICEAMACGLLPIVRNLDAYKKVYKNNVIYCDKNDDFIKKIKFYLENEKLRKELAKKAQTFITLYSWKNVAKRELEFVNAVLKNKTFGKIPA